MHKLLIPFAAASVAALPALAAPSSAGGGIDEVVARQRASDALAQASASRQVDRDGDPHVDWLTGFDEAWSVQAALDASAGGTSANRSRSGVLWSDNRHPSRLGYELMGLAYDAALSDAGAVVGIPEPTSVVGLIVAGAVVLRVRRRSGCGGGAGVA